MNKFLLFSTAVLVCTTAKALDFTADGLNYQLISADEQTCRIVSGSYSGDVVIPATVNYGGRDLKVIEMADQTLCNTYDVTSVVLGSNLKKIGKNCLINLNIETLTIPGSIIEIGDYSLALSKLKKLVIGPSPDKDNPSAITIGIFEETVNYTKYKRPITQRLTSLESLELYRDLSCNKSGLFQELPLQSVIIGGDAAVKSEMFYECVNLHSLEFTDDATFGHFGRGIGSEAFYNCPLEGEITFPAAIQGFGEGCFSGNHFSVIHFENTTGFSIGEGAFSSSANITSLIIPEAVTMIGKNAFSNCKSLKNLRIETDGELKEAALCGNDYDVVTFTANCTQNMIAASLAGKISSGNTIVDFSPAKMKELHINAPVPPKQFTDFHGKVWEFTEDQYVLTTLYVPTASLEAYKSAEVWKNFWNIKADPSAGIEDVEADAEAEEGSVKWYNLNGQLIDNPTAKGIYIKQVNDKSIKVIVP